MSNDALLQPADGPGRFEGSIKLAQVLHDLSLDDSYPEEIDGDVTETGVFGCLFIDLNTMDETRGKIGDVKAAILYEDSNGFISCDTFDTNEAAWRDWKDFTSDNERFYLGMDEEIDAIDSAPTEERFSLVFNAYCGMRIVLHDHLDSTDVRDVAAQEIQRLRDLGHTVVTLEKGREWESEEPEDSVMVPDTAGILSIEEG